MPPGQSRPDPPPQSAPGPPRLTRLATPVAQPLTFRPWTTSPPHDIYFRESFSRRDIAEDFLRHHLPAPLLAEIDLATLEVSKDTYVSTELRTAYSDLVYRVRCRHGELVIYLLFEHKYPRYPTGGRTRRPGFTATDPQRRFP